MAGLGPPGATTAMLRRRPCSYSLGATMSMSTRGSSPAGAKGDLAERVGLVKALGRRLGFFGLALLALEALMGTLIWKLPETERGPAFSWLMVLFGMTIVVAAVTAILGPLLSARPLPSARKPAKDSARDGDDTRPLADPFESKRLMFEGILGQLESKSYRLVDGSAQHGDGERLLDGLFAGLLDLARNVLGERQGISAVLTESAGSGADISCLRVRAFSGIYGHEVILRTFGLNEMREGVCSVAYRTQETQIRSDMSDELREKGERIKATIAIPVDATDPRPGDLATVNIDAQADGVIPRDADDQLKARIGQLRNIAERLNRLQRRIKQAPLIGRWKKINSDHTYAFTPEGRVRYEEGEGRNRQESRYTLYGQVVRWTIEWGGGSSTGFTGTILAPGEMSVQYRNSWEQAPGMFKLEHG